MSTPDVVQRPQARESIRNLNENEDEKKEMRSTRKSFILLALIFASSTIMMALVYYNFPEIEPDEYQYIKLPKSLDDAKDLGRVLSRYRENNLFAVTAGFFTTYVFLQTFAIPGSIFLSILSGFLFYFPIALFLVCLCSSLGASFCYLLSDLVGVRLVRKYIPDRVDKWASTVEKHKDDILNYIIFLRITPFLPNWFINITSPVLKVSLTPFFIGTFLGVAPPSFVAIQAGTTLYQLTYYGEAVSWTSILVLAFFAILSILPVLLKNKLREKYE
ncbi:transmembrane protein 41B-like [Antedon mediterranea]|uniref:transmembrane protein 41B-like n=1 Tax=Antedon mediterranea TaxID=105859 RepID=UPI003AF4C719